MKRQTNQRVDTVQVKFVIDRGSTSFTWRCLLVLVAIITGVAAADG